MAPDPRSPSAATSWRDDLVAVGACAATAILLGPLHATLAPANTAMLFLLVVVVVAYRLGRRPAVIAAGVSVALFDFFFIPPRFSFAVANAQYLVILVVMLTVALVISDLTQRLQTRAAEADERQRQAQALYGLAQVLAGAVDNAQVETALQDFVAASVGGEARLVLTSDGEHLASVDAGRWPPLDALLLRATLVDGHVHRCANPGSDGGMRLLLPLSGATCRRGVLLIDCDGEHAEALRQQQPMLEAVAALAATAIERLHFVAVAQAAELAGATERLRSSILSALSHDLRTPLTALYGLADSLTLTPPPADARDTAVAIRDQAARLDGMVAKLLDMARLKAGPPRLRREWQPLEEVVGSSLQLLGSAFDSHPVEIMLPADLPLLEFDAVLIERVLCNLLENAAKFSPPGSTIRLAATLRDDVVEVAVSDSGPGFPAAAGERVFDAFERGTATAVRGSGLGLTICRAIVDAHGGRIWAENRAENRAENDAGGGARVAFTLPRGTPPAIEAEA